VRLAVDWRPIGKQLPHRRRDAVKRKKQQITAQTHALRLRRDHDYIFVNARARRFATVAQYEATGWGVVYRNGLAVTVSPGRYELILMRRPKSAGQRLERAARVRMDALDRRILLGSG